MTKEQYGGKLFTLCKCGCGNSFYKFPSSSKEYFSRKCSHKGKDMGHNRGKKFSAVWIDNIRKGNTGRRLSLVARKNISMAKEGNKNPNYVKGKYIPRLCVCRKKRITGESKLCNSCARKEVNNFNWKGGITPLTRKIRALKEYSEWRLSVFIRDDFTCMMCSHKGGYLHAHHLKHFNEIITENKISSMEEAINCLELWFISNGITLCKKCHKKEHKEHSDAFSD